MSLREEAVREIQANRSQYGGPEALQVVEDECREPKRGEGRVRVLAAGVSLPDVLAREDAVHVPLDEALLGERAQGIDVLALDDALKSLSKIDARKAHVVELRYFGALTTEEAAGVLHISAETVMRDWKMAKTWLFRELTRSRES